MVQSPGIVVWLKEEGEGEKVVPPLGEMWARGVVEPDGVVGEGVHR